MEWLIGIVCIWIGWKLIVHVSRAVMFSITGRTSWARTEDGVPKNFDNIGSSKNADRKRQTARWIPFNNPEYIAEIRVPGGMIYIGDHLPGRYNEPDSCLINPKLKVATANHKQRETNLPYWPSYSNISPSARRIYLEWLASGRLDPDIDIGYVFLFFYGLERRLFVDKARDEVEIITKEVHRLLKIYGSNTSFHQYAFALLEGAALISNQLLALPTLSADLTNGYRLPLSLKIHIGARISRSEPIFSEDALRWLLSGPNAPRRTPISRCFKIFAALWRLRYDEIYPKGLIVPSTNIPLIWEYRSASGTFEINIPIRIGGRQITDVSDLAEPLNQFSQLGDMCLDELAGYSRFLGRNPLTQGSAEGATLLPAALLATSTETPLHQAAKNLDQLFDNRRVASTNFGAVAHAIGMKDGSERVSVAKLEQMAIFLEGMGIGFEPDPRFGSAIFGEGGKLILFRAKAGAPVEASNPDYVSKRIFIEVSALASASDGKRAPEEFAQVRRDVLAAAQLTTTQRLRLLAYAAAIWDEVPKQTTILNRLSTIPADKRRQILDAACATVLADGVINVKEVTFLEKLAKALNLGTGDVYQALHRGDGHADEPIRIAPAQIEQSIPIPQNPAEKTITRTNDADLERIRNETVAVQRLLADIFVGEDPLVPPEAIVNFDTLTSNFQGLDRPHSELLEILLDRNGVDRSEFERLARNANLLPDGALDTINDWAFDKFDEPLFQGGDTVVPMAHLRKILLTRELA